MAKNKWDDYKVRQDLYHSKPWYDMREYILYRDKFCRICSTEEHPVVCTEIDHIIPIRERPDLRLDPSNLQGLCAVCHGRKTYEEVLKGTWEKASGGDIALKRKDLSFLHSPKCSKEK